MRPYSVVNPVAVVGLLVVLGTIIYGLFFAPNGPWTVWP